MTDRLLYAEEQIAHLRRAVEDLSDVVRAQGAEIDRLTRRVALLLDREAEREAEGSAAPPGERPPHW